MGQMIDPLSRRLRVRDDGTGKSREIDGTFAEFEAEDAIVLLGDPGMENNLLPGSYQGNYSTVRKFLIEPQAATGGHCSSTLSTNIELLQVGKTPAHDVASGIVRSEEA